MSTLSDAQIERFAFLLEECSEVIQICGKILRHGLDSTGHPGDTPMEVSNRALLEMELGHVAFAQELLSVETEIDFAKVRVACGKKAKTVQKYFHEHTNKTAAQYLCELGMGS